MDRNLQRNGVVNLITLLVVGIGATATARYVHSATGYVALAYLALGLLVSIVSWFQMHLEARERNEKLEFDELNKAKSSATLFTSQDSESFPAKRSREQFERFFVPAFTVLLFLLEVGAFFGLLQWLPNAPAMDHSHVLTGTGPYILFFLVLFLLGKFSSNLARLAKQPLLRSGSSFMLLCAFINVAVIGVLASELMDYARLDYLVSRALCLVLLLIAAESLITLVLEVYRPRVKGKAVRVLYESRLVGLLGQPGGLITTVGHALDYQFGFKVSETGFYKQLREWAPKVALAQVALLWLSTSVVIVEPQQSVLKETFGKPSGGVLEPGLHFKLPWPIQKCYRYKTKVVQSINVGFVEGEGVDEDGNVVEHDDTTVIWTRPHYKEEFNLLVATRGNANVPTNAPGGQQAVPADLLTASVPVHFIINNVEHWAYKHASPSNLLEKLATREVIRYLVSVDMQEIMASGRIQAAEDLKRNIQAKADAAELGVQIVFVGLQDIHPPTKVADAYEAVNGSLQQREADILTATAGAAELLPRSEAAAYQRVAAAEAASLAKITGAIATAGRFTNQVIAYRGSPSVYVQRTYLETLAKALQPSRKYLLITSNTSDVITIDLQDKERPGLEDVVLPTLSSERKEQEGR